MSVKRSQFATFLNTGTSQTPTWSLIGEGVSNASIAYNPQTEEYNYIHEDTGSTEITAYKPSMPIEAVAVSGDAVFEYIDELRKDRAVLTASHSEIVNVWLYETPTGTEPNVVYPAEKQGVSIAIDEFGGEGGKPLSINFTINYQGDPVEGTFNPSTKAFTSA